MVVGLPLGRVATHNNITYNNNMDINEQTDALTIALDNLVEQFQREFDLNLQTIAGVLEDKKLDLLTGKDIIFEMDDED